MADNKTLLGKMSFDDKDLKTPEHDRILDILMDNAIISKIANIIKLPFRNRQGNYIPLIYHSSETWRKEEEYLITKGNDFMVGFIDLRVTYSDCQFPSMNIEVKTSIPSTGELIRQINAYRKYVDGAFVVIAPSFTYSQKKRLKEAGIYSVSLSELTKEGDL